MTGAFAVDRRSDASAMALGSGLGLSKMRELVLGNRSEESSQASVDIPRNTGPVGGVLASRNARLTTDGI